MRKKLIKLLLQYGMEREIAPDYADFLLANGVIVSPCKVGDTVYAFYDVSQYKWNGKVRQRNRMIYSLNRDCGRSSYGFLTDVKDILIKEVIYKNGYKPYIGKTVFLTREEAEKALEDRNNYRAQEDWSDSD